VRKLRSGTMPPPGAPRPDAATTANLVSFLESSLDRQALAHPNPGRPPAPHRLNRAEYANAVRDILGVDLDVTSLLPPDDSGTASTAFPTSCRCRRCSPSAISRPRSASARIAVGDPTLRPTTEAFR
jgi:hypothetical protein